MDAVIQEPMAVLALLLGTLALLFVANSHRKWGRVFKVVPLLVFAYFVPTAMSNAGLIPTDEKFALYVFIKEWLLPASLFLLVLAVDVKAILGLGFLALVMFLGATVSIVIGGPLAYAAFGWMLPVELHDQAWRGLAALAGSWIGGGANFVAMGEGAGAGSSILALMVVVDVAVANIWMAVLLFFAGREKAMDEKMGADRSSIDRVRDTVAEFQASVARPTNLPDLLLMAGLAFGATALSQALAQHMPFVDDIGRFTWVVVLATAAALGLSFTRLRRLEGAGASAVGSVFLYLLVATIGAKAVFAEILDPDNTGVLVIGATWMLIHIGILLMLRRILRAPIFFLAVGSQANIGGGASAPIVASAFHPALAPVGVLLAIGGYVLGVFVALPVRFLLQAVHSLLYASGAG
ncbi:MAG TPA: DUF819 family protein [Planctomycetota bacterium]